MINNYRKKDDGTFINLNDDERKRYEQARSQAVRSKQLEERIRRLEQQVAQLTDKVS